MQSILEDINNGKIDFNEAIKTHSTIQKKFPHMELNNIAKHRMSKIFGIRITYNIISMELGSVSDIIETKSGYLWIIKLNNVTEEQQLPLIEVSDHIKDILINQQIANIQYELFNEIVEKQNILFKSSIL